MYTCPSITEAKFKAARKQEMRKLWLRWKPRAEALKLARRRVKIGVYKNGKDKLGFDHQCAICHLWFSQIEGKPQVEVDHILPVGKWSDDITKWSEDLGKMYGRSLVAVEGLRILCKPCHLIVTNEEKARIK